MKLLKILNLRTNLFPIIRRGRWLKHPDLDIIIIDFEAYLVQPKKLNSNSELKMGDFYKIYDNIEEDSTYVECLNNKNFGYFGSMIAKQALNLNSYDDYVFEGLEKLMDRFEFYKMIKV